MGSKVKRRKHGNLYLPRFWGICDFFAKSKKVGRSVKQPFKEVKKYVKSAEPPIKLQWKEERKEILVFTCGRRPAGHVMMAVVVVVVVVVGGGGGGEQLLYMGSPRAHVWSQRIQKKNPLFLV